jgi:signal transduction histidine kinase
MSSAPGWQLSRRITTWCVAIGTSSVALLAAVGIGLVHLETLRGLEALATEELEEMVGPFASSAGTREDFARCAAELQHSHPYNAMAWRVWSRSDGSIWGTFGAPELQAQLPTVRSGEPTSGHFPRWRTGPLNAELELGLLLGYGREVASEERFVLVALLAVVFAAGISFATGKILGRRIGGALETIAAEARLAAAGTTPVAVCGNLPDEMRAVVVALGDALASIRGESDKARLLAAGLAHELRSPLQNLLMQAEVALLRERSQHEYCTALAKQVLDLQELIRGVDNLVTLCASPEARKARFGQSFDFTSEARLRLRGELARANAADIALVLDLPAALPVRGDREGLMLALRNLVANAIDWSPAGGRVAVRAEASADAVLVEVDDQGPGVLEADRERIFRPFEHGPARSDGRMGYGLGLALVRTVTDQHQGSVDVARSALGGAAFRLRLPIVEADAPEAPAATETIP